MQNIIIQDFTLQFKHHSKVYPNYTKFTSLLYEDYPCFSYIYRINSKTQVRLKPNSSKIAHFSINHYLTLHFSTIPQNFIEVFTDDKPGNCATMIQNSTDHVVTLPTGHLTDTEYVTLCNLLLKYKTCYATHKNDVGNIATPFRIRLKPNAQLITQRPSKVPIHYRDKLEKLLKELEKHNIIKPIGSSPQDKPVYGTTYLNPLIIKPKGDSIKCVLDARHLNSNTEHSDESWPIEPLAPQLARANKKYKCAIDLMYAYAHSPFNEETINLTSFSSGDKLFLLLYEVSMVSKDFPCFYKTDATFFTTLIEQCFAVVYINYFLLLSNSKEHMFHRIEQVHIISTKNILKLAPEKSVFMLLKDKFLGNEIGYITIKPLLSKISAIHKIPSPTGKVALMSFIGALNICTKFFEKLHTNLFKFY